MRPPGDGWRAFTHLERPQRTSFINVDHAPVKGKYPVGAWKAGEIIRDEHSIRLPRQLGDADGEVYVGLWRGDGAHADQVGPARHRGPRAGGDASRCSGKPAAVAVRASATSRA